MRGSWIKWALIALFLLVLGIIQFIPGNDAALGHRTSMSEDAVVQFAASRP